MRKKLEAQTVDSVISKSRDNQVVMGCLRLVDSLYTTKHDILSQDTIRFCTDHQNKDIREYARLIFDCNFVNEL